MSLLDCLADVIPRRERAGAVEAVITRHLSEITEARERGFTWWQITVAARKAWDSEWPEGRKLGCDTLAVIYNRIRKEARHG